MDYESDSSNHVGAPLLPSTYKILSNIVSRLTPYVAEIIGNHQCGFQLNRSSADQIFLVFQILEKK